MFFFNNGYVLKPSDLTVIVGANNTGKSRILKDIHFHVAGRWGNPTPSPYVIVQNVEWTSPESVQDLRNAYYVERVSLESSLGSQIHRTIDPLLISEFSSNEGDVWPSGFDKSLQNAYFFSRYYGNSLIAFLTTENRLLLLKEFLFTNQDFFTNDKRSYSLLKLLYEKGRVTEKYISKIIKESFGIEIALDFSSLSKILFRIVNDSSSIPVDPRDARIILGQYPKLDEQGDGLRSFAGIVTALLSVDRSLFLIDEPEAFLHPPQAFAIGKFLAKEACNKRQLIVATHSTDILRGILSQTQDVTILRVERDGITNSFKVLAPDRVKELVTDPLLSSARVLDGLFYKGVVVVEADSDARFYYATSNKYNSSIDLHFVNADNKQTVPKIIEIYRDMGVRCAGIVDFDVLNNPDEFKKQLVSFGLTTAEIATALSIRSEIDNAAQELPIQERVDTYKSFLVESLQIIQNQKDNQSLLEQNFIKSLEGLLKSIDRKHNELLTATKPWKDLKEFGRSKLPEDAQVRFDQLWMLCARYGLYINPCGELESMLIGYGIKFSSDKRAWINQALQLLPNIEVDRNRHPWKLIHEIHEQFLKADY